MNSNTEEFLQKLAPCIEHGDLDACVQEAAQGLEGEAKAQAYNIMQVLRCSMQGQNNNAYFNRYNGLRMSGQIL